MDGEDHPLLLALHTCGDAGSVALGLVDTAAHAVKILAQAELRGRTYSANLIPEIRALLAGQQATLRDVQAIVAVRGPGSFTGIRVGLSTAKGLAEAASIPLIALSRLALLAKASGLSHVLAAIDAGRGEYYVGEYCESHPPHEMLLTATETLAMARQPAAGVLVSEETLDASRRSENQGGANASAIGSGIAMGQPILLPAPDAAAALRLALDRFRSRSFEDVETLDANYLRRSDAELFGASTKTLPV